MAKTREQLKKEGVLLIGPIVPVWFKLQSDGCSVPLGKVGRVLLKAKQARPACIIHDFGYYLVAIKWPPGDKRKLARMSADYTLKLNRKLVAKVPFFGRIYAWKYFRAVRLFGASSVKTYGKLQIPPSLDALDELINEYLGYPLTERAERKTNEWRAVLEGGV